MRTKFKRGGLFYFYMLHLVLLLSASFSLNDTKYNPFYINSNTLLNHLKEKFKFRNSLNTLIISSSNTINLG